MSNDTNPPDRPDDGDLEVGSDGSLWIAGELEITRLDEGNIEARIVDPNGDFGPRLATAVRTESDRWRIHWQDGSMLTVGSADEAIAAIRRRYGGDPDAA